jgi:glutamate dehydrogenase (NAD(P)+)
MKVVGVGDVKGAIHVPGGIDPTALAHHFAEAGTVVGFPGADVVASEELFTIESDIAIPAALGGAITEKIATTLAASVIVEAANGPTTGEAAAVFDERGIPVVPDVLANAGGVVASYFEWAQDLQGYMWEKDLFTQRLETTMHAAFDAVWVRHGELGVNLRETALAVGVERIAEATRLRGLFP